MRFSGSCGVRSLAETFYDEKSTSASFSELVNFLKWCRANLKLQPYIIGGWAVYAYVKKQKSLDIDVVFEGRAGMDLAMEKYYLENSFVEEELHDQQRHFLKEIPVKGQKIEIRFDAFCFSDKNMLLENLSVEIPWKLLKSNFETMEINGINAKMPNAELLLMLKAKAFRDRTHFLDLRGIRIDPATRARTKAKLLKDEQDIRNILEIHKIDRQRLSALLEQTKFKRSFSSAIRSIVPSWKILEV